MAPQKFADLGKEARDLINKSFHHGTVKLEGKTTTANGTCFTTDGVYNTDNGGVTSSLETKLKLSPYGVAVTTKVATNNVITGTLGVENKVIEGLKVDVDGSYSPVTGKTSTKLKTAFSGLPYLHATADVASSDFTAPTLNLSTVFAHNGFHLGYQASYDTGSSKLCDNNISAAYKDGPVTLYAGVVNASKYLYSAHHAVNDKLSVAAALECDPAVGTSLMLAGNYALDDGASMKLKLDNNLRCGLSFTQKMSGYDITLSGLVNGKAMDQGGHKIGLSFNFSA